MSWKVSIKTADLIDVLKRTKVRKGLGKKNIAAELVEFELDGKALNILVISAQHSIPAAGEGKGLALVPLSKFQLFQKAFIASPGREKEVSVAFDSSNQKITFGTTTLTTVEEE